MSDQITSVNVDEFIDRWNNFDENVEIPVRELIQALESTLQLVPEQYRDRVLFVIHASGDDASVSIGAHYHRPETDGEKRAREQQESRYKNEREAGERAHLAWLKAKYETPDD